MGTANKIEKKQMGAEDSLNLELEEQHAMRGDPDLEDCPSQIAWTSVVRLCVLHVMALYGLVLLAKSRWQTLIFSVLLYITSGLGITAGAHRLWSHRSYKAATPLRILLAIFQSSALQNSIFVWSRDHRVHHKYSETNADPHNARRGFFFAHIGWLMLKKHPAVTKKGSQIPLDDLLADPVVSFQHRYYAILMFTCCVFLPTITPYYMWGESVWNSYFVCFALRTVALMHATWCVNSVAHMRGSRPYDKHINPADNLVVVLGAMGEGFHNYHHTFPRDYSTSEFGSKLNLTTRVIDLAKSVGLVGSCFNTQTHTVQTRMERTGDGTPGILQTNRRR